MKIGVPKETYPNERRVALVPAAVSGLTKAGYEVLVEKGAGIAAGYPDSEYEGKGASLVDDRKSIFSLAEIVTQVRGPGANPAHGNEDIALLRENQILIAMLDPLAATDEMQALAKSGATVFGMELMPRITRAQSMDVLSSMASVAGYLAVLIAATKLPKFFPMFMTAAGTISPAHVFVLGAGVAGLQAIATAKRLGAVVQAYDVRPAVKEQVESLGGKFVEFDVGGGEGEGGYAKELTNEQKAKQAELMAGVIQAADVVITTAAVPGKKSPILIREDVVKGMKPGSVIVDLAAEKGGNVDLTKPGETIEAHGVTIVGTLNLPSHLPYHASQMYAKNIQTFLQHLGKEGTIELDLEDEITKGSLVARGGEVVHPMVKDAIAKG
ncbi:MAG: Re/Si-specific NAD(P)(+) transhydrogenase subunit alpha [Gemmatimonadetes bacterium]|nr:Re/Si-specific NAD(P)(+) transhydrogenase subunit alpha [Gemmatimonadota bacterium]